MTNQEILTLLNDDNEYYNGIGKQFISNSDIGTLIKNPKMFKVSTESTIPMLQGNYFHKACLEPEKLIEFPLVDASTRTTNIYKDATKNGEQKLLLKEAQEMDEMVSALRFNDKLSKLVWDANNKFEVPFTKEIDGLAFKCKVDIVGDQYIYDLKTTSSLEDFKYSSKKYNYDSQAALYEHITGKTMVFIALEKGTNRLGLYHVTADFRESGWGKVGKAIENYNKFFGKNPTEDINQYIIESHLF